jgi:hypothetical protein
VVFGDAGRRLLFVATITFGTLQLSRMKTSSIDALMHWHAWPCSVLGPCCAATLLYWLVSVGSEVPKGWCDNTGDGHAECDTITFSLAFFELILMPAPPCHTIAMDAPCPLPSAPCVAFFASRCFFSACGKRAHARLLYPLLSTVLVLHQQEWGLPTIHATALRLSD